MEELYQPYFLKDNPFPADPSLKLDDPDKRINGSIFNEEIFGEELVELDKLLRRRTNLIYCQNKTAFVYGVGKSAIIAHTWRKNQQEAGNTTNVYIRSHNKDTPAKLAAQVIREWHRGGFCWRAFGHCLNRYVTSTSSPEIRPEGARLLTQQKWPVDRVDLRAFLCYNPPRLIDSLADWICGEQRSLSPDVATTFLQNYLSSPREFLSNYPKTLRKLAWDEIEMLGNMLAFMGLGGFEYHYLFFDQFEDSIHGLRGKDLIAFASGMRRLLVAGTGRVSIIVTIHPGAVATLETPDGQEFATLAPLDRRHTVQIEPLELSDAEALAVTYLQEFRRGTPPNPLYPLTSEAIQEISEVAEGNIRQVLRGFNLSIEEGVDAGYPPITLEFLHSKQEDILGEVSPEHIPLNAGS